MCKSTINVILFLTFVLVFVSCSTEASRKERALNQAIEVISETPLSRDALIKYLEMNRRLKNEHIIYAVDNMDTNWNVQAVRKAREYVNAGIFSRISLIETLVENDKFLQEQAEHGVDNSRTNWSEQAVKRAIELSANDNLTPMLLRKHLIEEYRFTETEAIFAVDNSGNNWNEIAFKRAEQHRNSNREIPFTTGKYINILTELGFSIEQAMYADNMISFESDTIVQGETLIEQFQWLQNNAISNTTYRIEIRRLERIPPQTLVFTGRNGISIRLTGVSEERVIAPIDIGSLFIINNGVNLILDKNISLQGRTGNNAPLIVINRGGLLTMFEDSSIVNNPQVGVNIKAGGSFNMVGGKITGNTGTYGGGILIENNGSFTMSGGEIMENNSSYGAGVALDGGKFTLIRGSIHNNNARAGSSVFVNSGAVFIMEGGEIRIYAIL